MKTFIYVGAKILKAEPETRDGVAGFKVVYPDGHEDWAEASVFEANYREPDETEKRFLAEAYVPAAPVEGVAVADVLREPNPDADIPDGR